MGEIIKIDFNNNEKNKEESSSDEQVADVIDFKKHSEEKGNAIQLKEEMEKIIKISNTNKDGTHRLKFDLKLENIKRGVLKNYLISQELYFYSIDNEMNTTKSGIGLDLDIDKDQILGLLEFFKKENIDYTYIE